MDNFDTGNFPKQMSIPNINEILMLEPEEQIRKLQNDARLTHEDWVKKTRVFPSKNVKNRT